MDSARETGARFVEVLWSEEKASDVNLATQLYSMYMRANARARLCSNDSDVASPIAQAAEKLPARVGVFNPDPSSNGAQAPAGGDGIPRYQRSRVGGDPFPEALRDRNGGATKAELG